MGMNLGEKFRKLVESTRADEIGEEEPEAPIVSPDEILADALGGWATDERATKVFVPWLAKEMELAIRTAHANRQIPTEQNYALGFEAGLRHVRDALLRWASG